MKVTPIDQQCFQHGCACIHYGAEIKTVKVTERNEVLEEVAKEFDKMPFGDTSQSFAIFVRNMKQ